MEAEIKLDATLDKPTKKGWILSKELMTKALDKATGSEYGLPIYLGDRLSGKCTGYDVTDNGITCKCTVDDYISELIKYSIKERISLEYRGIGVVNDDDKVSKINLKELKLNLL